MQCTLLIMCIAWRHRQHKLGIDDFGHPLHDGDEREYEESEARGGGGVAGPEGYRDGDDIVSGEDTPLLVKSVDGGDGVWKRWRAFRLMKGRRS
jgi:hypothetical protein